MLLLKVSYYFKNKVSQFAIKSFLVCICFTKILQFHKIKKQFIISSFFFYLSLIQPISLSDSFSLWLLLSLSFHFFLSLSPFLSLTTSLSDCFWLFDSFYFTCISFFALFNPNLRPNINVWHKFDLLSTPQSRLRNLRVT